MSFSLKRMDRQEITVPGVRGTFRILTDNESLQNGRYLDFTWRRGRVDIDLREQLTPEQSRALILHTIGLRPWEVADVLDIKTKACRESLQEVRTLLGEVSTEQIIGRCFEGDEGYLSLGKACYFEAPFSPQQINALAHLSAGHTEKEAGDMSNLSLRSITKHVAQIKHEHEVQKLEAAKLLGYMTRVLPYPVEMPS